MGKTIAAVVVLCGLTGIPLRAAPHEPSIRQIDYVVESYEDSRVTRESQSLFILYLGSPETERLEAAASAGGVTRNVSLVHPAEGGMPDGARSALAARGRWYVTETDTSRSFFRRGPLLNRIVWSSIPAIERHVLMALGPDDDELVLISWNGVTGSLSVYYTPRVQTDRPFYERKLELLSAYLQSHDPDAEVPYERIDPPQSGGALISSLP